ncbi:MAG: zinc-binding dehydrogenase [Nannocystaceae bacterium]|nr:zinc-binding dehydrogenase [Nannocystaceae bacterium]
MATVHVFDGCLELLNEGGTLAAYGATGGDMRGLSPQAMQRLGMQNQRLVGFVLLSYLRRNPQRMETALSTMMAWVADGRLPPLLDESLSLSAAAEAHAAMESRTSVGKITLQVS